MFKNNWEYQRRGFQVGVLEVIVRGVLSSWFVRGVVIFGIVGRWGFSIMLQKFLMLRIFSYNCGLEL